LKTPACPEDVDRGEGYQQPREVRQQRLIDRFENDPELKIDPYAKLLTSLIHFYDRERKPKIFSYFQRMEKTHEELFDDDTVVSDLSLISTHEEDEKLICIVLDCIAQINQCERTKLPLQLLTVLQQKLAKLRLVTMISITQKSTL
jgi:hypothetical protein